MSVIAPRSVGVASRTRSASPIEMCPWRCGWLVRHAEGAEPAAVLLAEALGDLRRLLREDLGLALQAGEGGRSLEQVLLLLRLDVELGGDDVRERRRVLRQGRHGDGPRWVVGVRLTVETRL